MRLDLKQNPFLPNPDRPRIFVTQGDDPYDNARRALAGMNLTPVRGKKVLLKPNVGRPARVGAAVTTHPQVVAAALDACQEAGARVVIGEGPITGVDVMDAFETCGIAQVARERNCPLLDMDIQPASEWALPKGKAISSLQVCSDIEAFDFIVSIPVMKMHMHTHVTLSVKNMKGCLWRRSKVKLHMLPPVAGDGNKPINIAIADMSGELKPHLALIDGTVGMEGLGPSAGTPRPMGVVVAGADPFAADAVACELMGTSARVTPHLAIAGERGYGVIRIEDMDIQPRHWRAWTVAFEHSPQSLDIHFPGMNILDKNSCSACQSTLLLFLKKHGRDLRNCFPRGEPIHIAIGKGHDQVPENTLCIGNCTLNQKKQGLVVKGCPPVVSEVVKALPMGNFC